MDLSTRYLGLELNSPLVASASPLTAEMNNIRALEDAGAGAVVLPSLFEEEVERDAALMQRLVHDHGESFPEALSYFPETAHSSGPDAYLERIRRAREAVDMPVIASLNGVTSDAWVRYAAMIEEAGASAIELNIYFIPSDLSMEGRDVERRYIETLEAVRRACSLPLAVKLGPFFSAPGHMALRLARAGADGLVLFNRFYQPDIDLETLTVRRDLELSRSGEMRLPLLWIGLLCGRVGCSLAASTGVESGGDVIKYLLAGADVVMTTSALLRHGPGHMSVLRGELTRWLEGRKLSLDELRGSMSHARLDSTAAFERANYLGILSQASANRWRE